MKKLPYGLSSDIWALGCVFFAMLTGKPPFEGSSIMQTFSRTKSLEFSFPDYVSPLAQSLISSMLDVDPGSRLTPSQILSHEYFQATLASEGSFYEYSEAPLTCRKTEQYGSKLRTLQSSLLSPISTYGLQPFVHENKKGRIEITAYGWVKVLIRAKLMEISPDGTEVYFRGVRYRLKHIPPHAEKVYRYAEQCINTIRSKTPKVIIEDKGVQFVLMSDLPDPTFEAQFPSGIKVLYQVGQEEFTVVDQKEQLSVNISEGGEWDNIIQITLQGLKSCVKIASSHNS